MYNVCIYQMRFLVSDTRIYDFFVDLHKRKTCFSVKLVPHHTDLLTILSVQKDCVICRTSSLLNSLKYASNMR